MKKKILNKNLKNLKLKTLKKKLNKYNNKLVSNKIFFNNSCNLNKKKKLKMICSVYLIENDSLKTNITFFYIFFFYFLCLITYSKVFK